ncbi:hypothetical protein KYB31_15490 [Clostridium felsineum]|uniref:hypothetical protein n=1 Tax=Clostridium felsineum TaxID=36839 RepID=UPI00214D47A9|nr:hypothetical protein [Clostridium felsineum]MCR3760380.1 hypothetical protein [Clostridium felsineum]
MLAIRSQNKMFLGEYFEVGIVKNDIRGYVNGNFTILGEYATKERALEVLNEIQLQIQSCTSFDKMQGPTRTFMQPVFEMPDK